MNPLIQLPPNNNSNQPSVYPKWMLYRAACYLGDQGLSFGDPIVPHASKMMGKSSVNVDLLMTPQVDIITEDMSVFADNHFQHVFVGQRLSWLPEPIRLLKELVRKLHIGGHLTLGLKLKDDSQNCKTHYTPEDIEKIVGGLGRWQKKAEHVRGNDFLLIYKKLDGKQGMLPVKPRSGKPRACIARYGALGDMIIITPLIHQLAEDGYEVTMNISPYCLPVIERNPFVSNIALQERDMIPNQELGQYWAEWAGDYERYINLSESLEGRYLKVEGRKDFFTPKSWRIETGEHNYYDATMKLGGYPEAVGRCGEVFFTAAEERNTQRFLSQHKGKFIVIWALNGSSHHKVYPQAGLAIEDWLLTHDDSIVITVGDKLTKSMGYEHQRLLNKCGEWSIRESLLLAKHAGLVVGPETMMTNAAGSFGTPTITMLSHSTHEALCKYWPNDYCLAPDQERAPCYPCFQLHYTAESCPLHVMENGATGEILAKAPACALSGISAARVVARMEEVYSKRKSLISGKIVGDGAV